MSKTSSININIALNDKNIPDKIEWVATDQEMEPTECKAFLLSLFDAKSRDTLKIDLWTEEMQVVEMDRFIFHTMRSLADTYIKATHNKELANEMQRFATYFGEKTGIITAS